MEYARQDLADELLRLLSAGEDEPILFAAIVGSVEGFVSSTPREGRSTRYADIDAYLIIRESDSGQVLSILRQAHSKLAERFPEAVFLGGFVRSYRNQSGPPGARASKALALDSLLLPATPLSAAFHA